MKFSHMGGKLLGTTLLHVESKQWVYTNDHMGCLEKLYHIVQFRLKVTNLQKNLYNTVQQGWTAALYCCSYEAAIYIVINLTFGQVGLLLGHHLLQLHAGRANIT